MKLKFTYTLFCAALAVALILSNSAGRANGNGAGNTGAPGDEVSGGNPKTCQGCHGVGSAAGIQVTLDVQLLDSSNNVVTQYLPNKNYTAKVTVNTATGAPARFGYQMLALLNNGNVSTNSWSSPSANSRIATANGRSYAEQKSSSVSNVFSVAWKAPAAGKGATTFYVAGCGVNGNGGSGGDAANFTKIIINEKTTATDDLRSAPFQLTVLGNPTVGDELNFIAQNAKNGDYQLRLFSLNGQLVSAQNINIASENQPNALPLPAVSSGIYLLQMTDADGRSATTKVIK